VVVGVTGPAAAIQSGGSSDDPSNDEDADRPSRV